MNRERAETYLRLLAEQGLRHVEARPTPSPSDEDPAHWAQTRLARVARALSSVHAIDADVAEEVRDAFELALAVRRPGGLSQVSRRRAGKPHFRPGRHRPRPSAIARTGSAPAAGTGSAPAAGAGSGVFVRTGAGASSYSFATISANTSQSPTPSQAAAIRSAPWRVLPVGRVIRIRDGDVGGVLCLLSFAQTAAGARFVMAGWLEQPAGDRPGTSGGPGPSGRPGPSRHLPRMPSQYLTAVDDQGTDYRFGFSGGGSSSDRHIHTEWEGTLEVRPDPPQQIRWLDITSADLPVTRIDLDPSIPVPDVTVTQTALSAGEVLLDGIAAEMLVSEPGYAPDRRRPLSAPGLPGDIIAALRAAEALPPSSPVPGQLTWLAASLAGGGASAPPAGVPEPWLSLLAYRRQAGPPRPVPEFCAAAVTVELPEIDGARFAVLGLFNGPAGTVMHVLATGLEEDWRDTSGTGSMPALWLRDHRGQWHTTRMNGFSSGNDDEALLQLAIEPPLERDTRWLELHVTGQRAQVRVRLPLRWT